MKDSVTTGALSGRSILLSVVDGPPPRRSRLRQQGLRQAAQIGRSDMVPITSNYEVFDPTFVDKSADRSDGEKTLKFQVRSFHCGFSSVCSLGRLPRSAYSLGQSGSRRRLAAFDGLVYSCVDLVPLDIDIVQGDTCRNSVGKESIAHRFSVPCRLMRYIDDVGVYPVTQEVENPFPHC
jgi:hypothetical protein